MITVGKTKEIAVWSENYAALERKLAELEAEAYARDIRIFELREELEAAEAKLAAAEAQLSVLEAAGNLMIELWANEGVARQTAESRANAAEAKLDASEAREEKLREALKEVSQTLAWIAFGECRGFSDNLLSTSKALAVARTTLQEN
jgi:chromosome segregation ATPase